MVLLWIVILIGIVLLVRWMVGGPASASSPPAAGALEILEQRYARGEITRDQFQQMREDLRSTAAEKP